jgi:DNA-binding NarL/FixJ family response regulator
MAPPQIRVLVVEDDSFTRTTVCATLRYHGVLVVGEAANAREGLQLAATSEVDAVLLDLDLGGGPNGIDLASALRKAQPTLGIVILTTYEDPRLAGNSLATLPADVSYLVKRDLSDSMALPRAVRAAIKEAQSGARPARRAPRQSVATSELTDAQLEVMRLVAEGLSNVGIAEQRSVTEGAVEKLINRTARQLGIESTSTQNLRVQIARSYLQLTGTTVRDGD